MPIHLAVTRQINLFVKWWLLSFCPPCNFPWECLVYWAGEFNRWLPKPRTRSFLSWIRIICYTVRQKSSAVQGIIWPAWNTLKVGVRVGNGAIRNMRQVGMCFHKQISVFSTWACYENQSAQTWPLPRYRQLSYHEKKALYHHCKVTILCSTQNFYSYSMYIGCFKLCVQR